MMSERERWLVYPLLVLAIAMSVKTQFDVARIKQVVVVEKGAADGEEGEPAGRVLLRCNELVLQAADRKPQIRMGTSKNGNGMMVVYGSQGQPAVAVGSEENWGFLETLDKQGKPLVRLSAFDDGGAVVAVRPNDRRAMLLGHSSQTKVSGLFDLEVGEKDARIVPRAGWVEVAATRPAGTAPPPAPNPPQDKPKQP